jgi:hypothetical protein
MTAPAKHVDQDQGRDDKNYPHHEGPTDEGQPGIIRWGTLVLPTPKDDTLTPAKYPLGAGSDPDPEQQAVSQDALENEGVRLPDLEAVGPLQPAMPPVNSDNYQAAAAADKGSEIKGSAESKIKSSEAQETEKKEKEAEAKDKAKFQTGHVPLKK